MAEYLPGFLDELTVKALAEDYFESNTSMVTYLPQTITMWYDFKTGTIYGFGDGRPMECPDLETVEAVTLLYNHIKNRPLPEFPIFVRTRINPGLETALASIRAYRDEKTNKIVKE